jgi:hypothetical protein
MGKSRNLSTLQKATALSTNPDYIGLSMIANMTMLIEVSENSNVSQAIF